MSLIDILIYDFKVTIIIENICILKSLLVSLLLTLNIIILQVFISNIINDGPVLITIFTIPLLL